MGRPQHSSVFTYAISRPYPFHWFTPVVVLGGLLALALFSLINFVSTGYTLVNDPSSNPNATIKDGIWFEHWPSFLAHNIQPICTPFYLPVGSKFFTNQTALTYTLQDIWQTSPGGAGAGDLVSPSLTYVNNVLENCSVTAIEMDWAAMDRTANQLAFAEWGALVRTYATCAVSTASGTVFLNMTQEYDYVPPTVSMKGLYTFLGSNFLTRNQTDRTGLWWGESLLSVYWAYSSRLMQDIRVNQTTNELPGIRKGTLFFTPTAETDITDLDFFKVDYRYVVDKGQGDFDVIYPGSYGRYEDYTRGSILVEEAVYPNIWQEVDVLAKAAYSTVLTDLGQVNAVPNILNNRDLLKYFTGNFSTAMRHIANARPGPSTLQYGPFDASYTLDLTPSVISTRYSCQVPQRKSSGNLFIAILIADLVFLQALWFLFRLGVDFFFLRKGPDTNNCVGCRRHHSERVVYRDLPPEITHSKPDDDEDEEEEEFEMGGLKPNEAEGTRFRGVSTQRLVQPVSMDLGYRLPTGMPRNGYGQLT